MKTALIFMATMCILICGCARPGTINNSSSVQVTSQITHPPVGNFNDRMKNLADQLDKNVSGNNPSNTYMVTSFANLDKLGATTALGRLIAENLIHGLQTHKWQIVEARLTKEIDINAAGEFSLSRDIAKLKDEGAYVAIGTTLSRGNLSEVENVIQVAERFEVPIKFKRVKPLGRAVANNLLILPGAPGYALAMDLIGKSKWSRLEGILEKSTCQSGDDIDPEFDSCGAGTRSMGINAKGQFSTCFFLGDHFLEGNVREQSIADIWKNGRAFLEIRESVAKGIPECDICQRRRICHGECRAVALHMGGTLNSVDPGCPLKAV